MQSVDTEAESYFLWKCCRKGDPFQGPKPGSCLTLGNELSEETHLLTEQEILLGKGAQVESRRVREPRRTAPPWLTVSGCMVMGLVSGSSLANPSDSKSFLVVHALSSQDGCQRGGFWEGRTCGVSLWPFLNSSGWWWLITSVFLTRTSCHKQLMQMVTVVPGQGGQFQSVCFP